MADPRRREAVSTEIELDGSDPVEVCVMWLGRRILTVRRRALAGDEPLDDEIEMHTHRISRTVAADRPVACGTVGPDAGAEAEPSRSR
jgi:hypothetical protein